MKKNRIGITRKEIDANKQKTAKKLLAGIKKGKRVQDMAKEMGLSWSYCYQLVRPLVRAEREKERS